MATREPSRIDGATPRAGGTSPAVRAAVRRAARRAGWLVSFTGLVALFGWWWWHFARSPAPASGGPPVGPAGAVLLVLCGTSLALGAPSAPPRWAVWSSRLCAGAALMLAGVSLFERLRVVEPAIDRLALFPSAPTLAALLLAAAALLFIDRRADRGASPAQFLALVGGSIPTVGLLGHAFEVPELHAAPLVLQPHGMVVLAAAAVLLLSAGILAARPHVGPVALVTSSHAGGVAARRLLLGLVAFLPVAFLIVLGHRFGLYDKAALSALLAFSALVEGVTVVLSTSSRLERAHATDRRQYEDEADRRAWLMSIIDQMPDGVILLNDRGGVEAMNRALVALSSGDTRGVDAAGIPALFEVPRPDGGRSSPGENLVTRALARGETITDQELDVRREEGRSVPIVGSAAPVRDPEGRITGAVAIVRDVSPIKELERLREEWASIIAHDLRQPVGVISLTAQLVLAKHGESLSDQGHRAVERILAASRRLGRMIKDLLDFSRIESRRLSLETRPVEFRAILQAVVDSQRGAAAIRVAGDTRRWVTVDPDRIHQVFDNLISNALKYGRAGAEVRIDCLDRGDRLEVVVTNQGAGISPEDLPRLFSRFGRTRDARAEHVPGIGLGLFISRGLIEAHGGRIWAESVPGESTSFHLTLPCAPGVEAAQDGTYGVPSPEAPLGTP
jgi:signal transduction histidine kinase